MPDKELLADLAVDTFDRLRAIVASLDDAPANADLGVAGSKSPYQILAECTRILRRGAAASGTGGVPPARDRDAARGSVAGLLERAASARAAFLADLASRDQDATPAATGQATPDPGTLAHLVADLTRHLGQLELTRDLLAARGGPVRQLRLVVEADDFDRALGFYRDVLGMRQSATFDAGSGARGVLLEAGRATLELNNPAQRRHIDLVEVGHPTDPHIRVGLEVADAERITTQLVDSGALVIGPVGTTPWGALTSRLQAPAGLEVTVFQEPQ